MHAALSSFKTVGASFSEEIPHDLRMCCITLLNQTHSRLASLIARISALPGDVAEIVCFIELHEIVVLLLVNTYPL